MAQFSRVSKDTATQTGNQAMGKGRLTVLDVAALVKELRALLIGLRLANVYSLNAKTFQFKFQGANKKSVLIVESGVRMHTTRFERPKDQMPNNFATKLRKHLRQKRLEDVRQLGVDRVVEFKFGSGEGAFFLFLEFYAAGNIVLADGKARIMSLLRPYEVQAGRVAVREVYPVDEAVQPPAPAELAPEILQTVLLKAMAGFEEEKKKEEEEKVVEAAPPPPKPKKGKGKQKKQKKPKPAKKHPKRKIKEPLIGVVLTHALALGNDLVDHALRSVSLCFKKPLSTLLSDPSAPLHPALERWLQSEPGVAMLASLSTALRESAAVLTAMEERAGGGFLVVRTQQAKAPTKAKKKTKAEVRAAAKAKEKAEKEAAIRERRRAEGFLEAEPEVDEKKVKEEEEEEEEEEEAPTAMRVEYFSEFFPVLLRQHDPSASSPCLYAPTQCQLRPFASFNEALDEFFAKAELQQEQLARVRDEKRAWRAVERVRTDHEQRLKGLTSKSRTARTQAAAIRANLECVGEVLRAVNTELAAGIDWHELEVLIKQQREEGNEVARCIRSLDLAHSEVVVELPCPIEDSDSESESESEDESKTDSVLVTLQLGQTVHQNAQRFFEVVKMLRAKETRTHQAAQQAVESAQKITEQKLQQVSATQRIRAKRKVHWWEKFHWFVSSENYLVVCGQDKQQNEIIVKRYLNELDVYVHGDFHGAASCMIKNPTGKVVPSRTLQQAALFEVAHSNNWRNKIVETAYWVYGSQVSKTAPSGEYLPTGSFMVRGRRNYVPPQPLVMAFALLFRVDADSEARHSKERVPLDSPSLSAPEEVTGGRMAQQEHAAERDVSSDEASLPDGDEDVTTALVLGRQVSFPIDYPHSRPVKAAVQKAPKPKPAVPTAKAKPSKRAKEPVRGRKGRGRKGRRKGREEMDEEDLELARKLYGGAAPRPAPPAPTEAVEEVEEKKAEVVLCFHCKQAGHLGRDCPTREAERPQEQKAVCAVDELSGFTGIPVEEDGLLYAMAMCAPLAAVSAFKYKVKLVPGGEKRSKATRTAMTLFMKQKTLLPQERALLKSIPDTELVANILSDVRVAAPGAQRLNRKKKKQKKRGKV